MALNAPRLFTCDYDMQGDILYVSLTEPQPALSVEIEPDVLLRYTPPNLEIVGITFLNFRTHFPALDPTHALSGVNRVVEDFVHKYPQVPSAPLLRSP